LGWTSHQVVGQLRRRLGTTKIGHGGTLDPLATGLLVCGVGRATRLLRYIQDQDKVYQARLRFGVETSTEDAAGTVTAALGARDLTQQAIEQAAQSFIGQIQQTPSSVSAIKVNGQRAYRLVRQGQEPELKARTIAIHRLVCGRANARLVKVVPGAVLPVEPKDSAGTPVPVVDMDLMVSCSVGTYIRALARDLGRQVGTGAHLIGLRRLRCGTFDVNEAQVSLAQLESGGGAVSPLPITTIMTRVMPVCRVDDEVARQVRHGQTVALPLDEPTLLVSGGDLALAVYGPAEGARARPQTVLAGVTV
jgi:tRNA pseudouridine55 synthase